ncbi:hypothetical protein [Acidocella aminolytica]|uniref:hypothetical protein n=1 Tax=Acidocella aminolytica TaxID=33998 RepID=UPI00130E7935
MLIEPWRQFVRAFLADHAVEGVDLSGFDERRYAGLDRGDRHRLGFAESVPADRHEACNGSGRRGMAKAFSAFSDRRRWDAHSLTTRRLRRKPSF